MEGNFEYQDTQISTEVKHQSADKILIGPEDGELDSLEKAFIALVCRGVTLEPDSESYHLTDSQLSKDLLKATTETAKPANYLSSAIRNLGRKTFNHTAADNNLPLDITKAIITGNFVERVINGEGNCLEFALTLKLLNLINYKGQCKLSIVRYKGLSLGAPSLIDKHFGVVMEGDLAPWDEEKLKEVSAAAQTKEDYVARCFYGKNNSQLTQEEQQYARQKLSEALQIAKNYHRNEDGSHHSGYVILYGGIILERAALLTQPALYQ